MICHFEPDGTTFWLYHRMVQKDDLSIFIIFSFYYLCVFVDNHHRISIVIVCYTSWIDLKRLNLTVSRMNLQQLSVLLVLLWPDTQVLIWRYRWLCFESPFTILKYCFWMFFQPRHMSLTAFLPNLSLICLLSLHKLYVFLFWAKTKVLRRWTWDQKLRRVKIHQKNSAGLLLTFYQWLSPFRTSFRQEYLSQYLFPHSGILFQNFFLTISYLFRYLLDLQFEDRKHLKILLFKFFQQRSLVDHFRGFFLHFGTSLKFNLLEGFLQFD